MHGGELNRDLNDRIFGLLETHVSEIFPQLKGIQFIHRWGGPVSITLDMAPVIGYLGGDKKAIFSLGCMGHGVSLTTLNGKTIAELIAGQQTHRTEMFFVGRRTFPWPSDPLPYGLGNAIRGFMKMKTSCIINKSKTTSAAELVKAIYGSQACD